MIEIVSTMILIAAAAGIVIFTIAFCYSCWTNTYTIEDSQA